MNLALDNTGPNPLSRLVPNGREIAFTSWRSGNWGIWIVEAEGGEPRQVTTHTENDHMPGWFPDGQYLFSTRSRSLLRLPVAGGEAERIVEGPVWTPRLSPDGKIVFFTRRPPEGNLWAESLENGNEYQLTNLEGRRGQLGFNLATDGRYLYFHWNDELADL